METNAYCWREQLTARGDEEDQGTSGLATSEIGLESNTILLLNRHTIAISGGPWPAKVPNEHGTHY